MDDASRHLVIVLSMHRSGSSLTTRILERLGMSLGPYPLNGAAPSNPYGHYESMPFMYLNMKVQSLVHGFDADLPDSPEVLARFVASRGVWPADIHIPDALYAEGRELVRGLLQSGRVSGFKDPRTVLAWPFWRRVLDAFPEVRVIPLGLLRSPHEMAMSLVTRRQGMLSYWDSLDVAGLHLGRLRAILAEWGEHPPCLCFGDGGYLRGLEIAARWCGLEWKPDAAIEAIDRSCVHHEPAVIAHWAQEHFDVLRGMSGGSPAAQENRVRLESDARAIEKTQLANWARAEANLKQACAEAEQARRASAEAENRRTLAEAQFSAQAAQLADAQNRLAEAWSRIGELQATLSSMAEELSVLREQAHHWRTRLERLQSNPVISLALEGRRTLRRLLHSNRVAS